MSTMSLKINTDVFPDVKKGQVIKIAAKNGVPVGQYWRNRLIDSEIDNCVSVVNPAKKEAK